MKRLSKPLPEMAAAYDAIIVGSGYGGGAAASRLARMGLKVAVLERGAEWHPGEFPDTPVEAVDQVQIEGRFGRVGKRTALFDFRVGDDINVLVGCGLGGTSLINANVSLRADLARSQQSCHQPPFDDAIYARGIFGRSFQLNCPLQ